MVKLYKKNQTKLVLKKKMCFFIGKKGKKMHKRSTETALIKTFFCP